MTTLGYTRNGEYLVPNLTLKEHSREDIGKYGRLRRTYLMDLRKGLYTGMLLKRPCTSTCWMSTVPAWSASTDWYSGWRRTRA